jgi:ankyrin repeat protein
MPWTPLHIAIADESDLKVHEMAQDGTILEWLNETDEAGVTPLHLAAETSQSAIVQARYCLSHFAASSGLTRLHFSCCCHWAANRLHAPNSTERRQCTSLLKKDVLKLSAF